MAPIQETSNQDRARVIDAYERGGKMTETAQILGIKRTTALGIIKAYKDENRIEKKQRGGPRGSKLTDEHRERIRNWVDEDSSLTLRALAQRCLDQLQVSVSPSTVDRALTSFHYTLKRTHLLPTRRNDEQALQERAIYANMFLGLLSSSGEENIVFLDEVGFSISIRAKRGRSLHGTRAVHVVSGLRTRNFSCCCAMTKAGIVHQQLQNRPFNTQSFKDFLGGLFEQLAQREFSNPVLIADNVAFHRTEEVATFVQEKGARLVFLPPYSPFLNPIENLFSKWKGFVRQGRPTNEAQLMSLIEAGQSSITSNDCTGFFRHMLTFIRRCINRETIIDE